MSGDVIDISRGRAVHPSVQGPVEPVLQVMPKLEADVRAALRDSINRFGVLVPIAVTQDGTIIDGHNRWEIAQELGTHCPRVTHEVAGEADALELARTLNMDRRHMERTTRIQLAASLREQGHSLRAIAGALNVSKSTVVADLVIIEESKVYGESTPTDPATVVGADGVSQPATKRKWTSTDLLKLLSRREQGETVAALAVEFDCSPENINERIRTAKKIRTGEKKPTFKSADAVAEREAKVREMATAGHSSRQIASTLGLGVEGVKRIAKRIGVSITADAIVGSTRLHDSNRIVEETTIDLDGSVMTLGLVDMADLDPNQIEGWVGSISDSLRALTRFRNQLKEKTP